MFYIFIISCCSPVSSNGIRRGVRLPDCCLQEEPALGSLPSLRRLALALIFRMALSCLKIVCPRTFIMTTFLFLPPYFPPFFTPLTLRAFSEPTLFWVLGEGELRCPGSTG